MTYENIWNTLSSVDCNEHTENKGNLIYLSWAWAWGILMEYYPSATFEFADNETHADGSMTVHCTVTIGECQRSMWLPVMDYKNAAIKSANSRDISDNKMRCLTKALALFGLGHYIYAGEDTVNAGSNAQTEKAQTKKPTAAKAKPKQPSSLEKRMAEQKELVASATPENINDVMDFVFRTIFHFALPPEGAEQKEGDPETVAGWIDKFTSSNGNKKTLIELYNAGFKNEIKALNTRLDKIRALDMEQLYQLLNEKKESKNG
tara:strand:+ start:547 stop:1332 length:786 start_codon:yes stop_codon:yes gene_type:complete